VQPCFNLCSPSPSLSLSLSLLPRYLHLFCLSYGARLLSLSLSPLPLSVSLSLSLCLVLLLLTHTTCLPPTAAAHERSSHCPPPCRRCESLSLSLRPSHAYIRTYTAISEVVCLPTFRSPSPFLPPHCALYLTILLSPFSLLCLLLSRPALFSEVWLRIVREVV